MSVSELDILGQHDVAKSLGGQYVLSVGQS